MDRTEAFTVIGPATRTTNADEADPDTARISDLWARVARDPRLAGRGDLVAVLTDYESDAAGAYTYVVGVRIAHVASIPEGHVAVTVPAAQRERVTTRGPMPEALIGDWREIWRRTDAGELRRAYGTDYELPSAEGAVVLVSVTP